MRTSILLGNDVELICGQSTSTEEGQCWSMLSMLRASFLGAMDQKPISIRECCRREMH
jgi:hypothetical protein